MKTKINSLMSNSTYYLQWHRISFNTNSITYKSPRLMIKNYALVLAFFMLVTNLFGQQIDLATATTVAHNCFHAAAEIHNEYSKQNTTLTLTETITARVHEEHTNLYFIFTAEGEEGFVIVSADQRARPIIAYSLKNTFVQEEEHQPEAFRKWMQHYRQEIKTAIYENATIGEVLQSEWEMYLNAEVPKDGNKVDPLTTTTWDQPFPYNAYCPQDPNTGQRAVVGCVATAMAQIMRYHAHPAQGSGFHSYNHPTFGTVSANFGSANYNWNSMPNFISSFNEEVAELSFHCGVSIEMGYGVDVSGVSSLSPVADALKQYFSYSSTTSFVERSNYNDGSWLQLMKSELEASRPIEYAGIGNGGGHAWVMDGVDNNNFFHMNWGWGGYQDGYFTLNALNPNTGGTGAGNSGFNYYQQAVIGIQPAEGASGGGGNNEPDPTAYTNLVVYSNIIANPFPINFAQAFELTVDIANLGSEAVTGDLSAAIFTQDGTFIDFVDTESGTLENGFFYTLSFSNDGLPTSPGSYQLALFYRPTNGEWTLIPPGDYSNPVSLDIVGPANDIQLYSNITANPTPIVQGEPFSINVDYANFGNFDYTGEFSMDLYTLEGEYLEELEVVNADLCANCHFTNGLNFNSNGINVEPGTYLLATWNRPSGGSWQIVGTGDYTNPIQITVKAPAAQPDPYENNDIVDNAYPLSLNFSGNSASLSTTGTNMHDADDNDYFAIDLAPGYSYTITPRAHDSYNSGNGQSYTNDVLYSVFADGEWSEVIDDQVSEPFIINGGQTIYFGAASYFVGTLGTYQLDIDIQRSAGTSVEDMTAHDFIRMFPNPTDRYLNLQLDLEQTQIISYKIFNTTAQIIDQASLGRTASVNKVLDLGAYPNGTYFILLNIDGTSYRQSIILNR